MREQYKPSKVECLFICESPPLSKQGEDIRFFYNPNSVKWDFLFGSLMEVIYQEQKSVLNKANLLDQFRADGYFLVDAVDFPINNLPDKDRRNIILREQPKKLMELRRLIDYHVPVFLIKRIVHELYYSVLVREGYLVKNDFFLPFPSTGNQKKFKNQLTRYMPIL